MIYVIGITLYVIGIILLVIYLANYVTKNFWEDLEGWL